MASRVVTILLICMVSLPSFADEKSHKEAAVEMVKIAGIKDAMDGLQSIVMKQIVDKIHSVSPCINEQATDEFVVEVRKIVKVYEHNIQRVAKLYVAKFSEDEINEINTFYRSKVGKKFADEQGSIMREISEISQKYALSRHPDINEQIGHIVRKYANRDGTCKIIK